MVEKEHDQYVELRKIYDELENQVRVCVCVCVHVCVCLYICGTESQRKRLFHFLPIIFYDHYLINIFLLTQQLEVSKPLVNLLDNMVRMGSLYGGDNLMLASQYKQVSQLVIYQV